MEAAPGIYSMGQSQGGNVHAFLLDDGNGLTLIDTLFDADAGRILAQVQAIGKTVQDIKHIISGDRSPQPVSILPYPPYRTYPLQIGLNLNLARHAPVNVDHFVHEGDRIGPVQVLFAPGHSPGHLAFYWPERRALVTGDAVCTWPTFMLGWKGFLLNPKQHQVSLRRLAELDAEVLCVGHGEPLTSGGATRLRAALHR